MKSFTVIGHFKDTGKVYVRHIIAETADSSAHIAASFHDEEDLEIVAVIEGEHQSLMSGDHVQHVRHLLN